MFPATHDTRPLTWLIRAEDRTSGTTDDFTLRLASPLRLEEGGWIRVAAVSFPASYYTITLANNSIDIGGGFAATTQIVAGNYTPTELAAVVQTALQVIDAGFSCTYLPETMTYQVAHTTTAFSLDWATGPSAASSMAIALGFDPAADTPTATLVAGTLQPTYGEPLSFYLESATLTRGGPGGLESGTRGSKLLQRIPNAAPRNDQLHWTAARSSDFQLPFRAPAGGIQLSRLDFKLRAQRDWGLEDLDLRGGRVEIELEVAGLE